MALQVHHNPGGGVPQKQEETEACPPSLCDWFMGCWDE